MSDLESWNLIIGALMPPVVSVVLKAAWPAWVKSAVAVCTAVAVGLVSAAVAGDLTGLNLVSAILLAGVAMKAAYETWWKPTGISPWVETKILP